jgi:hypothetical protein
MDFNLFFPDIPSEAVIRINPGGYQGGFCRFTDHHQGSPNIWKTSKLVSGLHFSMCHLLVELEEGGCNR